MDRFFIAVLNMSITGSYVILAILLMRLLLRPAPKRYTYFLWLAAAFRLVCPVSFTSGWSFLRLRGFDFTKAQQNGAHLMAYVPQEIGMATTPQVSVGINTVNQMINSSLPAATPYYSANPMQIWLFVFECIWIIGITVLALYAVGSYTAVHLRMRTATRLEGNVYCSERVRSPFILGLFRPRIYLPYGVSDDARIYVLTHERYHLKRFDHITKLLAFCIAVLHWFNPLVWVALVLFGKDQEMRTDEAVLSDASADIRKAYSTVLLGFAANHRFPIPKPLAFGETAVKTRIRYTLRWKRPTKVATSVCLCVTAAVLIACIANPPGRAVELKTMPADDYYTAKEHLYSASGEYKFEAECIYQIRDNLFASYDLRTGEVFSLSSGQTGFRWMDQEQSYSALMRVFEAAEMECIERDYSDLSICPIGEDDGLARVGDELWFVEMDHNDLLNIYLLEQTDRVPEYFGFNYLEWSFNPIYSSRLPALRFGCDFVYDSITAVCKNGTIIAFDEHDPENGYPSGTTLTVPYGQAIYWAPSSADYLAVLEDTVEITVTLPSGTELTGTISISGSRILPDEPGDRYKYFAKFSSDDLFMRSDYENGGGVLRPIEHHLSIFDYPLVD